MQEDPRVGHPPHLALLDQKTLCQLEGERIPLEPANKSVGISKGSDGQPQQSNSGNAEPAQDGSKKQLAAGELLGEQDNTDRDEEERTIGIK